MKSFKKNRSQKRQEGVALHAPEPQVYPHENHQKHLERCRQVPNNRDLNPFSVNFEV